MNQVSPCKHCTRALDPRLCEDKTCTRALDPRLCEDKTCARWRKWFTVRWDQTRQLYLPEGERR